ncbi:MAG TPA: hypothetical protein DD979_15975 [Gammaproteobacteria bacterium]|nr:hypothetical protein [Gammaproteobacteria bacterium]
MTDGQFSRANLDFIAAHLLLDTATVLPVEQGEPVSDEELALLLAPESAACIGTSRLQQMLSQIASDQRLFEQWRLLLESRALDGEFTAAARRERDAEDDGSRPSGLLAGMLDWLVAAFLPGPRLAAVACVFGVGFLTAYLVFSPREAAVQLVIGEHTQPERASTVVIGDVESTSAQGKGVNQVLRCTDTGYLCFSATRKQQHWFMGTSTGPAAVSPPIIADEITSIRTAGDKLLVEYVKGDAFRLVLLTLPRLPLAEGEDWSPDTLFEDAISNGFFDQLVLDGEALHYWRKPEGQDPEAIRFLHTPKMR